MSKTLVIVESPSKCKKIEQYLGSDYKVLASYGHFTKLDSLDQIQFDTFQINYKIDNAKVLKTLKSEIKKSKDVILATDDDREGEAIAWALCIFCKLDITKTKKMVFQEITKAALMRALDNICHINMDRVRSQQARQILDIFLGYKISPLLWKYVQHKLSAGRCQTPALKLIYDNQKELDELTGETHFQIKGFFTSQRILFQGTSPIQKENIEKTMNELSKKDKWFIEDKKEKQTKENPPTILITSSLQQKAHQLFKFSPKQTMKYAQELYENGFITYMRTDSACYSEEFTNKLQTFIQQSWGEKYVHPNIYSLQQNKNKNKAQEAHEGIRVCDLQKTKSDSVINSVNTLYQFIYKHSIQCAMSAAQYHETQYITNLNTDLSFKHLDKTCIFKGWTILEKDKPMICHVSYLNTFYDSKNSFALQYAEANENLVQHKYHFHEASLIKQLESFNIGRPSTFATIVQNILDKKYVNKGNIEGKIVDVQQFVFILNEGVTCKTEQKALNQEKNKLYITPLGKQVCEFCYKHFETIFQYDFTDSMETKLDEIEWGKINQTVILKEYINTVTSWIESANCHYNENPEQIKKIKDQSLYCGKYKNDVLYIKNGKYGYYVTIHKKQNISLKEFRGFSIEEKINNQEEVSKDEFITLIEYINQSKEKKNENMCVELSSSCSIRKSKYGYYIFYQTKTMKKPKFLKYNDEKDKDHDLRIKWIEEKNKQTITNYIVEKYKMTI